MSTATASAGRTKAVATKSRDGGAHHSLLPLPSPSLLLLPQKSLVRRLVVALMPPPIILSTLPPPLNTQPRPIEAPSPLVRWRLSSHLPLICRLVVALTSASASHHLLSCSRCTRLSSTPPLCSHQLVVPSHLFGPPLPLDAPPPHDWLCRCHCRCAGVVAVDAQASSPSSQL